MTIREFLFYLLLLVFAPRSLKTMEWRMLRYLNRDRRMHSLSALRMQEDLRLVARRHSQDMADKDYFDHVNRQRQAHDDRLRLAGVTDVVSGENLAKIGGYPNPTQKAEDGLMHSPGHRANILNGNYNTVGIGIVQDRRGVYYFTQNFARRLLVFKRSPAQKVRLAKGLRVYGEAFGEVAGLIWQIRYPNQETPLKHGAQTLKGGRFDFRIFFDEPGRYSVLLFTNVDGKREYQLANSLEVSVRRGFLW